MSLLEAYGEIAGLDVINHLRQLADMLRGIKIVHVNSTRIGGGVAEILTKMIPLKRELGIEVRWEIIRGEERFYECTKNFHNGLQGNPVPISESLLNVYEQTNAENAEELRSVLEDADVVFIHDPQPLPLITHFPKRKGKWVWRCHIDLSHPYRPMWKYLRKFASNYDASIFSLADFAQPLPHKQFLIPPSIDPLSDKNREITQDEMEKARRMFDIDEHRPMILQVSRFDRFKDPVGVIQAYRLAKVFSPNSQLILAGGGAADDPEGEAVLAEVRAAAGDDPDIQVLLLPPDANVIINALQRSATLVLQKSLKEGFGLTVTEAMWKSKPVIGGNTGGIRLQVFDHHTGYLVNTPEGAAMRMRYFMKHPDKLLEMGKKAREFVRQNFLNTRNLREFLTLMVILLHGDHERIELGGM